MVSQQHNNSRQKSSQACARCYIAVAYCRHCYDSPINAVGNVLKTVWISTIFNNVHHIANGNNQNDCKQEENDDFFATLFQRLNEQSPLVKKGKKLENTEDTEQSENSDGKQRLSASKENSQITWQSCK